MPTTRYLWLIFLVLGTSLGTAIVFTAMRVQDQRIKDTSAARLEVERGRVISAIDRLSHLPIAVAQQPDVQRLVSRPLDETVQERVNRYLQNVGSAAQSSILYVVREDAIAIASSDWQSNRSLLGNSYGFRPYFYNAMKNREARYFAIGVTTNEAGYYIAQPIVVDDRIYGVAVVKIGLDNLQEQWRKDPSQWLLLDEHGVVILASNESVRYQSAPLLSASDRSVFTEQRKYADFPLTRLDGLQQARGNASTTWNHQGKQYLVNETHLEKLNWNLLHLSDTASVKQTGVWTLLTVLLTYGMATLGLLYFRERRRKLRLSRIAEEAQRIRSLNDQLNDEIVERKHAETNLRDAQAELIQASKLAALGQMSAAIAHEINQPLSALRTYSASTRLLIERDRHNEALQNLEAIESVTQRMANLTGDLKVFARKSDSRQEPVALTACLKPLIALHKAPLEEVTTSITFSHPNQEIYVNGNRARIEQVVSNLIKNAVDATENMDKGRIQVALKNTEGAAVIEVADNGAGIENNSLGHLFDPFFTTKPIGQGLGLGLAISHGIVEEMNGQLRARNQNNESGAVFEIRLPQVSDTVQAL